MARSPVSSPKKPEALAEALDANFAIHASWALRSLPGATVLDEPELLLTDSGLQGDTFNIVCRSRLSSGGAARRVEQAIEYFRRRARGFSWWLGPADQPRRLDALLEAAGLTHAESETAMAADLAALREPELSPRGLRVRRVRTAAEMADFAAVLTGGVLSDPDVSRFYGMAAPKILSVESPQWFYVGYLDGEPVATAEVTVAGGVAGVYGVGTLERMRRQGFGSALTAQPLIDARNLGYTTGVLQASVDGAGLYRRLGFVDFGEVREFKPGAMRDR
jgi:ribosomal protein S18 acetylase RimI-like enzyme